MKRSRDETRGILGPIFVAAMPDPGSAAADDLLPTTWQAPLRIHRRAKKSEVLSGTANPKSIEMSNM
jgi:hypothetical protein